MRMPADDSIDAMVTAAAYESAGGDSAKGV